MCQKVISFLKYKKISLIFIVLSLSFFSCSDSLEETDSFTESSTLKYSLDNLYNSIEWTEELEFDRLTTKVSKVEGISQKLNLSPLIVLASVSDSSKNIYPKIEKFGSLDLTLLPDGLKKMLDSFGNDFVGSKDVDSFFNKDSLFMLSLFYVDFYKILDSCFDEKNSDNNDAEKVKNFFDSFVTGEPFIDGIYYEVPVKFFGKNADFTICVFCFESSGSWKIDQIQIVDWEISDGKK